MRSLDYAMAGIVAGSFGGYIIGLQFGWPPELVVLIGAFAGMLGWKRLMRMSRRMMGDF